MTRNIRAGNLRRALEEIRLNGGCGWSRTIAIKALRKENELKKQEEQEQETDGSIRLD